MALFEPYRAMGYVCSQVPFSLIPKGKQHFVTTVVNDAYHVYNVRAGPAGGQGAWRVVTRVGRSG